MLSPRAKFGLAGGKEVPWRGPRNKKMSLPNWSSTNGALLVKTMLYSADLGKAPLPSSAWDAFCRRSLALPPCPCARKAQQSLQEEKFAEMREFVTSTLQAGKLARARAFDITSCDAELPICGGKGIMNNLICQQLRAERYVVASIIKQGDPYIHPKSGPLVLSHIRVWWRMTGRELKALLRDFCGLA